MKKLFFAVIVIFATLGLTWYSSSSTEEIKIGFIGPLTGFGTAWGEEQRQAIELAVEEINAQGGIKNQKIKVVYEDGKCDAKAAVAAARKLITIDKVKVFLTVCSAESVVIAPIAGQNKILQLAIYSTAPDLSGINPYTFRNSYSDDDMARALAETIAKNHHRIGIITETNEVSVGLRQAFEQYYDGEIIDERYLANSTERDFRTIITKVLRDKPEAILLNPGSPAVGISLIKQMRAAHFSGPIYGSFLLGGSPEIQKLPEAEGIIFTAEPDVPNNTLRQDFFARYHSRYSVPNFPFGVAVTYDSVYMLKQALEHVGYNPDELAIYLRNLKNFTGVMGTYGFGPDQSATGLVPSIRQIKNKTVVPYTSGR